MVDREEPRGEVPRGPGSHEEFLELCALSTTGELSAGERKKLDDHLAGCGACRKAMQEFGRVVDQAIPAVAEDLRGGTPPEDPSFSLGAAEESFRKRLSDERDRSRNGLESAEPWLSPLVVRRSRNFRRRFDRYHFWLPLAAGLLLSASLGILTYRIGKRQGIDIAENDRAANEAAALAAKGLALSTHEVHPRNTQTDERDDIARLRREIAQETAQNTKLAASESALESALSASGTRNRELVAERDRWKQETAAGASALAASEKQLHAAEQNRLEDANRVASLEAQVAELSGALREQQKTASDQEELLAKDRDIRELMGARDLTLWPTLPPGTFVQIDPKQTRVAKGPFGKTSTHSQFARPIYFVDTRTGYACGWCQLENSVLTLIPHPDSGEPTRTFRYPSEAEVVGRVTGVAMRIGEPTEALLDAFGRKNPPKK
jgi:hypothetical protein